MQKQTGETPMRIAGQTGNTFMVDYLQSRGGKE